MKDLYIYICFLILAFLMPSCTDDEGKEEIVGNVLETVTVGSKHRKVAEGIDENDDEEGLINSSFVDGSVLYFSQMGPTDETNPNFTNEDADARPYLYKYVYYENPDANWDENYNFKYMDGRKPFEWDSVPSIGSVGNSFSFYAMYFPVDNTVRFEVEADQSEKDNFLKSDVMGAYHATSTMFTRMRFNLFHLMVYLKVTLYVPVFESQDNNGNYKISGFDAGSMKGAYVMNANRKFNINWRVNRSSDTEAPLTSTIDSKANIKMYTHLYDDNVIIDDFEVRDYYMGGNLTTDRVRAYTFSVLFPSQTFGDNFLCFALQAPDNSMKYYYFSGSQIVGDSGNYSLTQGTLQQLKLYLPRNSNDVILIGANILPWKDAITDMTVTKE